MFDKELALEILRQIDETAAKILFRFKPIKSVSDFTDSDAGMEKMNSICTLLIVIGESLKNIDKITGGTLLPKYPEIDWKKAKGMRDILTHHYSDISAEAVLNTCRDKIKPLSDAVKKMIREFE